MAMNIACRARRAVDLPGTRCRHNRQTLARTSRHACAPISTSQDVIPTSENSTDQSGRADECTAPGGVIGAAVITAARQSAGLTRRTLARRLHVSPSVVHAWEAATSPLYRVSYRQLRQLAEALGQVGDRTGLDLVTLLQASQCDFLVAAMLNGVEDYAEVPPIDNQRVRDLLRWALAGNVPAPYRAYAQPGPLLPKDQAIAFAALARELAHGAVSPDLAAYGTELLTLTATAHTSCCDGPPPSAPA